MPETLGNPMWQNQIFIAYIVSYKREMTLKNETELDFTTGLWQKGRKDMHMYVAGIWIITVLVNNYCHLYIYI